MAPSLDDIRKRYANPDTSTVDKHKGVLAAPSAKDLSVKRLQVGRCPACGAEDFTDLGFRHGGIHKRCNACTFEHTDTAEYATDAGEKRAKLIADAAVRHSAKLIRERRKQESRDAARRERRGRWSIEKLPSGDLDAILHFGKYKDQRISEIAEGREGRDYLRWLNREDFDAELKEIVQTYLESTDAVF